jgi:hypothetical protein
MARFMVGAPDPLVASITTPAQNPPQSNPEPVSQASQGTAVGECQLVRECAPALHTLSSSRIPSGPQRL